MSTWYRIEDCTDPITTKADNVIWLIRRSRLGCQILVREDMEGMTVSYFSGLLDGLVKGAVVMHIDRILIYPVPHRFLTWNRFASPMTGSSWGEKPMGKYHSFQGYSSVPRLPRTPTTA